MKASDRLYDLARNLLFPPKCILCRQRLPLLELKYGHENCLCNMCLYKWKRAKEESCPECLCPSSLCLCSPEGKLQRYKIPKLITYTPEVSNTQSKMIFSLKRKNDKRISEFMARELSVSLCRYLKDEGISPDICIFTYVPRRARAVGEFGFDQAKRLAEGMAKICEGKAVSVFSRRGGKEQKKLGRRGREANMSGAVRLKDSAAEKFRGRTVIVVDDLVTTGETLGVAVRLLRRAGAANVYVTAVGKTAHRSNI